MKTPKPTGYVLHRGVAGGRRFVSVVTLETENEKTGDMAQIWFLLEETHPSVAVAEGIDAETICRGCPFAAGNGCYVDVSKAPAAVWRKFRAGGYPELLPCSYAEVLGGRKIRFGAYGNPTLLPLSLVRALARVSSGWTGYFHDWRSNRYAAGYAEFFMASTETRDSFRLAQSLGFRTFHVSPEKPAGAVECLNTSTDGRVQCAQCKLACNGLSGRAQSVWIAPHGVRQGKAEAVAMGVSP